VRLDGPELGRRARHEVLLGQQQRPLQEVDVGEGAVGGGLHEVDALGGAQHGGRGPACRPPRCAPRTGSSAPAHPRARRARRPPATWAASSFSPPPPSPRRPDRRPRRDPASPSAGARRGTRARTRRGRGAWGTCRPRPGAACRTASRRTAARGPRTAWSRRKRPWFCVCLASPGGRGKRTQVDELGVSELAEQARVFIGAEAEYSWAPTSGRNFFIDETVRTCCAWNCRLFFSLYCKANRSS
jgi:hypothetical protein